MTTWTERDEVNTTWTERKQPTIYIAPLEWVNWIVHDEDDEVIYIISDEWNLVGLTNWTPRPVLND